MYLVLPWFVLLHPTQATNQLQATAAVCSYQTSPSKSSFTYVCNDSLTRNLSVVSLSRLLRLTSVCNYYFQYPIAMPSPLFKFLWSFSRWSEFWEHLHALSFLSFLFLTLWLSFSPSLSPPLFAFSFFLSIKVNQSHIVNHVPFCGHFFAWRKKQSLKSANGDTHASDTRQNGRKLDQTKNPTNQHFLSLNQAVQRIISLNCHLLIWRHCYDIPVEILWLSGG